jgi:predicted site-specific integrase-resolvase
MFPPVSLQCPRQYQGDIACGVDPVKSANLPVKDVKSYSSFMNLRRKAEKALDDGVATARAVADASRQVTESTQWATVALVGVAAVSVLALAVGLIALAERKATAYVDK